MLEYAEREERGEPHPVGGNASARGSDGVKIISGFLRTENARCDAGSDNQALAQE